MNIRVIASNLYDMIINTGLGNPPFNYAGPERAGRVVRRLQHLTGLGGDRIRDLHARQVQEHARASLHRLGHA